MKDTITIIIPTLNEEAYISNLLISLSDLKYPVVETIMVDGGSKDRTLEIAKLHGIRVIESTRACRSFQMNLGASVAKSSILYFVHADVIPPKTFAQDILKAINNGYISGCFSYYFDNPSLLLKFNSWCTKFKHCAIGGGDQTLFIKKQLFDQIEGFNERLVIMEDFDLVQRIRENHHFKLITNPANVSARKYFKNSWLKVQLVNTYIFLAYRIGASQKYLSKSYKKMLG